MRQIFRFLRLPSEDRRLVIRAALALWVMRLGLSLVSVPTLRRLLIERKSGVGGGVPAAEASVDRVVWAVRTAGRRTPWASTCLTRALAAQMMLAKLGEQTRIQIGVAKDEQGGLKAHAWLENRGRIVIGGKRSPAEFTTLLNLEGNAQ